MSEEHVAASLKAALIVPMLGLEELLSDEGGQECAHQEHPWCLFVFVWMVCSPEPDTGPKSTPQGWLVLARRMMSDEVRVRVRVGVRVRFGTTDGSLPSLQSLGG